MNSSRPPVALQGLRATTTQALVIGGAVIRVGLATALVALCISHWWATKARAEFDALPDYDYVTAADSLRGEGRFGEALLVVDAGLDVSPGPQQAELLSLKTRIETERDDPLRRLREVARGALTGTGDSAEALGGAIAADLLVIGDVRDLVIQGSKVVRGEPADEVIVALSTIGISTSVAPEVDGGISILKFARRVGALGDAFVGSLLRIARRAAISHNADEMVAVASNTMKLADAARPAGALKIMRIVDDPKTLRLAADFASQPGGAFALWLGGERSLEWLKSAKEERRGWLLLAARKGEAGITLLTTKGKLLFRAHPLLGLIKAFYTGAIPALLLDFFETQADAIFGMACAWLLFELLSLSTRFRRIRKQRRLAAGLSP